MDRLIETPPPAELGLVVVIPCHDEPALNASLASLAASERPKGDVEIIVVINAAVDSPESIRRQNAATLRDAERWMERNVGSGLRVHLVHVPDLPVRHAGVGLARKIGMDEALRRFAAVKNVEQGIIAGFDADCLCDDNFLAAVESHFEAHPKTPGCSIHFEHPLSGPFPPEVYRAVSAYELHLRYYIEGLRFAGFPHAYHTVGSAMAVRAGVYARQGGMNRRQAGEDFYFLHKVIPLGGFTDLTTTRVLPSPRPSRRVPFGTGRAVNRFLELGGRWPTYPPEAFVDLKSFFGRADRFWLEGAEDRSGLGEALEPFLTEHSFAAAVKEMREHSGSRPAFCKRFFRWFDGFRVMKYMHHARDRYYGEEDVVEGARQLLEWLGDRGVEPEAGMVQLLEQYRLRALRAGAVSQARTL